VHVIVAGPGNAGPAKTGSTKLATLWSHLRTIKSRYHGARPFYSDIPAIVMAEAEDETVDVDPGETKSIEGTIRVSFLVDDSGNGGGTVPPGGF